MYDKFELGYHMSYPAWLPPLVMYNDYHGWEDFIEAAYAYYQQDFVKGRTIIDGKVLRLRREPRYKGKDKAFWHICGHDEGQSVPSDFARIERIRWPRAIIINRNDTFVQMWADDRFKGGNGGYRVNIWFNREYLVVLEPRDSYILFITSYPTEYRHTVRSLEGRFKSNAGNLVKF